MTFKTFFCQWERKKVWHVGGSWNQVKLSPSWLGPVPMWFTAAIQEEQPDHRMVIFFSLLGWMWTWSSPGLGAPLPLRPLGVRACSLPCRDYPHIHLLSTPQAGTRIKDWTPFTVAPAREESPGCWQERLIGSGRAGEWKGWVVEGLGSSAYGAGQELK